MEEEWIKKKGIQRHIAVPTNIPKGENEATKQKTNRIEDTIKQVNQQTTTSITKVEEDKKIIKQEPTVQPPSSPTQTIHTPS